jgi:hypothetical protein
MHCETIDKNRDAAYSAAPHDSIMDAFGVRSITVTPFAPAVQVAMGHAADDTAPPIPRASAVQALEQAVETADVSADSVQFDVEDIASADPIFLRQCANAVAERGVRRISVVDHSGQAGAETLRAWRQEMQAFLGREAEISVSAASGASGMNAAGPAPRRTWTVPASSEAVYG